MFEALGVYEYAYDTCNDLLKMHYSVLSMIFMLGIWMEELLVRLFVPIIPVALSGSTCLIQEP